MAANYNWDLDEKPDFTNYSFYTYGYYDGTNTSLWNTDEIQVDKAEIKKITAEILDVINTIEFLPESNPDYSEGDMIMMLDFTEENWKKEKSDIIHIIFTKDGMCMDVWNRANNKTHYAFIYCNTQGIIEEICSLVKHIDEKVTQDREQKALEEKMEREPYQTEVTEIKKVYMAFAENTHLIPVEAGIIIDFEFGILSYKTVNDGKIHYAFYSDWVNQEKNDDDYLYISKNIDDENLMTFNYIIHKDIYDNKFYLNTKNSDSARQTVKLNMDANGSINRITVALNSGYKAEINKGDFVENGVLKNYGDLNIIFAKDAVESDDFENQVKEEIKEETKEEKQNDAKEEKTDDTQTETSSAEDDKWADKEKTIELYSQYRDEDGNIRSVTFLKGVHSGKRYDYEVNSTANFVVDMPEFGVSSDGMTNVTFYGIHLIINGKTYPAMSLLRAQGDKGERWFAEVTHEVRRPQNEINEASKLTNDYSIYMGFKPIYNFDGYTYDYKFIDDINLNFTLVYTDESKTVVDHADISYEGNREEVEISDINYTGVFLTRFLRMMYPDTYEELAKELGLSL